MAQQPVNANQGPGIVKQAIVVLDDTFLKAASADPTHKILAIPAPGEGRVIISPDVNLTGGALIDYSNWVADYTNVNSGCTWAFFLGENGGYANYAGAGDIFTWGEAAIQILNYNNVDASGSSLNSDYELDNQPVYVGINNQGDGAFTDGNSSNAVTIIFSYYIYNRLTKSYE